MSAPILSNSLCVLADRTKAAAVWADEARRFAHEKMIEIGALLLEAKEACGRGQWGAFLARGGIHEKKGRRYMQLARAGIKPDTVSELGGLKEALKTIVFLEAAFADMRGRGWEPPTYENAARFLVTGRKVRALERREPGAIDRILSGMCERGEKPTGKALDLAIDGALATEVSA